MNSSLTLKYKKQILYILLVPKEKITFGRDNTNDVRLALFPLEEYLFQTATADISRRHFMIARTNEGYTIQDIGSTNGTSIDCIALLSKERKLLDGHTIDVGGVLDLKVAQRGKALWLRRITNTPQESYLLFPEEITLGKATGNTLVIPDDFIQNEHAKISYDGSSYWLDVLEGTTLVNDTLLKVGEHYRLQGEDKIILGENLLLLFNVLPD